MFYKKYKRNNKNNEKKDWKTINNSFKLSFLINSNTSSLEISLKLKNCKKKKQNTSKDCIFNINNSKI